MRAVDPRVSFAELQQWSDDQRRYELFDGEVIVVPAPIPRHQLVLLNIAELLRAYGRLAGGLVLTAPVDLVLSDYDVLQPDLVFFSREQRGSVDMMHAIRTRPALAVEVVSRSTEARDRGRKMDMYARFGVPEYWIIDPLANTLEMYRLEASGYVQAARCGAHDSASSPTLPDLMVDGADVYAD